MAFSASEAAFEGFRILRREPKSAVVWAGFLLATSIGAMLLMLPFLRNMAGGFGLTPGTPPSPAAALAIMGEMGRLYLVIIPIYLIVTSVFTAAVYRAVLRPEDKGFGRLELGGDELRLFGLFILMGLLFFGLSFLVTFVGTMVAVGVGLALKSSSPSAAAIAVVVAYLATLIVLLWVSVRLSFAAPITFTQRRIRLFDSWKLTKGRFWSLFGCYVLAFVFVVIIALVDLVVIGVLSIGMNGGSFTQAAASMMRPDYSSYASLFTPLYIVRLLVGAVFGLFSWTVMAAAPAAAYRELVAPRPEDRVASLT